MLTKEIIKKDFKSMYDYLITFDYKSILLDEELKLELKQVHKAAYVFYIWKIELNKKGIESVHFDEIISTLVQIIYVSIYKDIKILYMLYRNIIDNFSKLLRAYFNMDNKLYTLQIFEQVLDKPCTKNYSFLENSYQSILNIYKFSCGYVHSTNEKFLSLNDSVRNYGSTLNESFKKSIRDFCNMMKNINYILIFLFRNIYDQLDFKEKKLINSFCNKKQLKIIYKLLYDVDFE
jgi:hypothetical protein